MDDLQVRLQYRKSDADDWTKVVDKAQRKKIQNRLAKRKSSKLISHATCSFKVERPPLGTDGVKARKTKRRVLSGQSEDGSQARSPKRRDLLPSSNPNNSLTRSSPGTPATSSASVDDQIQSFGSMPGLFEHRFLQLTQYSLMRALVQNAAFLALDFGLLMDDETLSPWTLSNPYPALSPHDLNPTPNQLATPHHPYLDIIALPAFRDNVLLACLDEDLDDQLCYELHMDSFTVWGSQPWNAMGMLPASYCVLELADDLTVKRGK